MSAWGLPTTVTINGEEFNIRSDYRAVLDALAALNDQSLAPQERSAAFFAVLYPDWERLPDYDAAFSAAMTFVNLGKPVPEHQPPKPQLVDWDKDVEIIAPAVDQVLGYSCRRCDYLHWWEFVGAYSNIGRGLFSEVVNIRNKRAKHQKLDKAEREFANENAELVNLEHPLTSDEEEFFKRLGV